MNTVQIRDEIITGQTALGIELGSTNIKAVLIASDHATIASGSFEWENQLVDGVWTYSLDLVWQGIQAAYRALANHVQAEYAVDLKKIKTMGISAMMHGYLPFDQAGNLLTPFRTWRNAMTGQAAQELTTLFDFNIPQRWSIAHLYQAVLNQEQHVDQIAMITTLAGYVHWQLTGEKVLGIGDASGVFPIDSAKQTYDPTMLAKFNHLPNIAKQPWNLEDILPRIVSAGVQAGTLSTAGTKLLDPTGGLQAGALFAGPEGDAGTGMVATNSVKQRTANISAGTSAFAMVVLEHALTKLHTDIDMVTTPDGSAVAMVHANNSTTDINYWVRLFGEFTKLIGVDLPTSQLYPLLFNAVLASDPDAGGMVSYGYYSGENITDVEQGRPLFVRSPNSKFSIGNLMRMNLYSAFGAMKIGLDILASEKVATDSVVAQGGIFKTPVVGQKILAAVMDAPVTVMDTAGEGGPWAMAILAQYVVDSAGGLNLADYLDKLVFQNVNSTTIAPDPIDQAGFATFMENYQAALPLEKQAAGLLK